MRTMINKLFKQSHKTDTWATKKHLSIKKNDSRLSLAVSVFTKTDLPRILCLVQLNDFHDSDWVQLESSFFQVLLNCCPQL